MLTVPLASLGGVLGIRLLNLFTPQTLDMLTMVGFIILLGAAVNNAILLVESTRSAERGGMDRRSAVRHALEERTRPIFATSLGQLAGLLPMIIVPGPGRRAVSRPRHRDRGRHAGQYRIHARAPAGAPAPRRARVGRIRRAVGRARARGRCLMNTDETFRCMVRNGGRAGRFLPGGQRGLGAGRRSRRRRRSPSRPWSKGTTATRPCRRRARS